MIGRETARVFWKDDALGYPRYGVGPHVNIKVDGIELHLFY